MNSSGFTYAKPGFAERVAAEKRRDREALANMPPEEAQALVSSGIPDGFTRIIVRGVPERHALGLGGIVGVDDED